MGFLSFHIHRNMLDVFLDVDSRPFFFFSGLGYLLLQRWNQRWHFFAANLSFILFSLFFFLHSTFLLLVITVVALVFCPLDQSFTNVFWSSHLLSEFFHWHWAFIPCRLCLFLYWFSYIGFSVPSFSFVLLPMKPLVLWLFSFVFNLPNMSILVSLWSTA